MFSFILRQFAKMYSAKVKHGTNEGREEAVRFAGPVPGKVVYVIEPNKFVSEGHILVKVKFQEDLGTRRARDSIRAPCAGKVLKVNCTVNSVLKPGDVAFIMSRECPHTTLLKGLCAVCGADVYRNMERQSNAARHDNVSEQNKPFPEAWRDKMREGLPVIHHVPELIVSKEYAAELGQQDQTRLLTERRLVLLVDLDETIIHTTDLRIDNAAFDPSKREEVTRFGIQGKTYHTKLRPHCRQFLAQIQTLYELHICTFGNREYAHSIASFIDPEGKLFSHRILSRNELIDAKSKTGNLKALFPCGDEMTCIIDDRPDMWDHAANLIHVEPYIYFQNQGDVNAPENVASASKVVNAAAAISGSKPDAFGRLATSSTNGATSGETARASSSVAAVNNTFAIIPATDDDDYLLLLEKQLKHLHEYWYRQYDLLKLSVPAETPVPNKRMRKSSSSGRHRKSKQSSPQQVFVPPSRLPSLKTIMPAIRKTVLRGCRIYVSDEVAVKQRQQLRYMHRLRYDECAALLGARVEHDSTKLSGITHIVGDQRPSPGAMLASPATSLGLRYVTPQWLTKSFYSWKRQDEARFHPTRISQQIVVNDAEANSMSNFGMRMNKPNVTETSASNTFETAAAIKRNADESELDALKSMELEIAAEFPDEFADDDASNDADEKIDDSEPSLPSATDQQNTAAPVIEAVALPNRRHVVASPPDPDVVRQRSERITRTLAQLQQRHGRRPIVPAIAALRRDSVGQTMTKLHGLSSDSVEAKLPLTLTNYSSDAVDAVDGDDEDGDAADCDYGDESTPMKETVARRGNGQKFDPALNGETDYDPAGIAGNGSDNSDEDEDDERLEEKWSGICLDDS